MIKSVGIYNNSVNLNNISAPKHPVMRGATNTLERTPEQDSIAIKQKKKKKLSTGSKIGLAIGGVFTALIGACILISRHETAALKKLYNEKLVISNLPEKLQFKEAQTLEEGIRFAKETLKIPEVDSNFTLEALNTANRGLVDVSNYHKGKLFMPRALRYKSVGDEYIAAVIGDVKSKSFGEMWINSDMFSHSYLDKVIKDTLFHDSGKKVFSFEPGKITTFNEILVVPDKNLKALIKKFYENPNAMEISDKQNLFYSLMNINNKAGLPDRAPEYFLKSLEKTEAYKTYIKKGGEKIDFTKLCGKKTEEQAEYTKSILEKMLKSKCGVYNKFGVEDPASTIYHEMGHLQDFAENLKKLDIMNWEFSLKKIWKESWESAKSGKKHQNTAAIKQVDNRWGSICDDKFKNLFDKNPEKFKKQFPDLYEFLTNQEIQQTAGRVSAYAQSGIGEFIAEVYAGMIRGIKYSDDVMNLYRKYGGPELPV